MRCVAASCAIRHKRRNVPRAATPHHIRCERTSSLSTCNTCNLQRDGRFSLTVGVVNVSHRIHQITYHRQLPVTHTQQQLRLTTDMHLVVTCHCCLSRKESQTDRAHPHMYLSWKIGEDRSSTFWCNWSPRGPLKKESNIGNLYSPAGQAGRAKQFSYWELWPLLTTDRKLQLIWMALIRLSRLVHLHWPLMTQNSLYSLVDFLIPTWATPA